MSVIEETANIDRPIEPPLRYECFASHHIEALLLLEAKAYPDPWTEGMFRQELLNGSSHFYVAYQDGELIGYGGFWFLAGEAHITKLTIDEPYRYQGLGSILLRYLLHKGREAGATTARLEVRQSNGAARSLYEKFGFEEVGLRKGYYQRTGESALVMVKSLC